MHPEVSCRASVDVQVKLLRVVRVAWVLLFQFGVTLVLRRVMLFDWGWLGAVGLFVFGRLGLLFGGHGVGWQGYYLLGFSDVAEVI